MVRIILLVGAVLCLISMSGCVQTVQTVQTPPAGAQLFESPPAPAANMQFVFETPDGFRWSRIVSEDTSPFRGKAVYRSVSSGGRHDTWDAATHNLIAVHDSSGVLLRYYWPHESEFKWPLWVGKSYRANFRQVIVNARRVGDRIGSRQRRGQVKVSAMEKITTPAGTFDTMRIEFNVVGWPRTTLWRARDIPFHVMVAIDGRTREVLADIRQLDRNAYAIPIEVASIEVSEETETFCRGFDETYEGVWLNLQGEEVLRFRIAVNTNGNGCYAWLNPVDEWGIESAGWDNTDVEISEGARHWGNEENGVHLNITAKSARYIRDGQVTNGRLLD